MTDVETDWGHIGPATSSGGIGLVLGAGGVTGEAFHLGALKALAELTGWDARSADVIVGTSVGSLVAAYLRGGFGIRDQIACWDDSELTEQGAHLAALMGPPGHLPPRPAWRRPWRPAATGLLTRPWGRRIGVLGGALLPAGQADGGPVIVRLPGLYPGMQWPERPLRVVAVRMSDGARVVFGSPDAPTVSVPDAVLASCAIPGHLKPVVLGSPGTGYLDGALHSPTNADLLDNWPGLDHVIVSAPMTTAPGARRPVSASLPLHRAWQRYLDEELATLAPDRTVTRLEPGPAVLAAMRLPHGAFAATMDAAYGQVLADLAAADGLLPSPVSAEGT
jgi:NTE family protein